MKHEARRVAEVLRSALREGRTAMLLIAAKTHQTIGWQAGEQPIIHSDAKHQEWKLRFLGRGRGGYEPRI